MKCGERGVADPGGGCVVGQEGDGTSLVVDAVAEGAPALVLDLAGRDVVSLSGEPTGMDGRERPGAAQAVGGDGEGGW
jgi:hypothetical protein